MTGDKMERLIIAGIILAMWAFYMFVIYKIHQGNLSRFLKTIFLTPITGERYVDTEKTDDRGHG